MVAAEVVLSQQVGSAVAAFEAGALIGTAIAPAFGTIVGAGVGIVVGVIASGALDYAYDKLPKGVTDAIDGGFNAIGHGVEDAGGAVGDTAKKVWHSIF